MKSQNTKTSSELHKEVRHEIKNLDRDLNAIEGRLTPGQFIDDAIFYQKGRNIGATLEHLKNNPVGTAFLSLGTILLMENDNHQTMERLSKNKVTALKDSIKNVKETVRNQLPHKEITPGISPSIGDIAKGKVTNLKDSLNAKVSDIKTSIQTKADEWKSELHVEASKVKLKNKASEYLHRGKDTVSNLDPMTYMALGASLGVLTGASLPVSEKERAFVQEKMSPRLTDLNSELQIALNECSNILKDLVISDVKNVNVQIFKS